VVELPVPARDTVGGAEKEHDADDEPDSPSAGARLGRFHVSPHARWHGGRLSRAAVLERSGSTVNSSALSALELGRREWTDFHGFYQAIPDGETMTDMLVGKHGAGHVAH